MDNDLRQPNQKKFRKVFHSDLHFRIDPTDIPSSLWGLVKWLLSIRDKNNEVRSCKLINAHCVVAARLGNEWKGMILYKH